MSGTFATVSKGHAISFAALLLSVIGAWGSLQATLAGVQATLAETRKAVEHIAPAIERVRDRTHELDVRLTRLEKP